MTDRLDLCLSRTAAPDAVPITPLTPSALAPWLERQPGPVRAWVGASGFTAKAHGTCLIADADGGLARVLVGADAAPWSLARLPLSLPAGRYRLDAAPEAEQEAGPAVLGWLLGGYGFHRYKQAARKPAVLHAPDDAATAEAVRLAGAVYLTRDLINTPASDLGPAELADAAQAVAAAGGAAFTVIAGDDLLAENYPTIHAVGRASSRAPRLVDFRWGAENAPRVTLVGKGVCFDSGGLDLKPADNMLLMKKDMGGAAHVLGLAQAIMDAGLRVRLRVLIPAVENSVSGDAYRPGDVIKSRNGTTVEIGNTDAEGRLVLCDALAEADTERPELMVDIATLTGAARVALGTEMPALFTDDDALAADLARDAEAVADPLWRLPLWPGYRDQLASLVADINHISAGRFGGAITAALFLKEFVSETTSWAHVDMMAWNLRDRPGRPIGGEAQALRALYATIAARYGDR